MAHPHFFVSFPFSHGTFFLKILFHSSPFLEKAFRGGKEQNDGCGIFDGYHPEGSVVAEMLCHNTTEQTADSESQIPTRKNTAVGCASLVVARHIDKHIQEGRLKMTVAQTDECCREVIGYWMLDGDEDDEAHQRNQHSFGCILR